MPRSIIHVLLINFILVFTFNATGCFGRNYSDSACLAVRDPQKFLNNIVSNPKNFIWDNNDDSCVLKLLDTLSASAIRTHRAEFLNALNATANISDGYVSEAFLDICENQFYYNFTSVTDFCYAHKNSAGLRRFIVEGISADIASDKQHFSKKEQVKALIEKKIRKLKITKKKAAFLYSLYREIDPKMFN